MRNRSRYETWPVCIFSRDAYPLAIVQLPERILRAMDNIEVIELIIDGRPTPLLNKRVLIVEDDLVFNVQLMTYDTYDESRIDLIDARILAGAIVHYVMSGDRYPTMLHSYRAPTFNQRFEI